MDPNKYSLSSLPDTNPHIRRVLQDLADRINYLTTELDMVRGVAMSSSPGVDAARRERPVEGTIIIPSRDIGGQDGFVRVSKDGVIVSYVGPSESLFPYADISSVGNVGGGLDTLHSFILPANTLERNGDYVTVWYGGNYATNDNDKRVDASFGGTAYEDTGLRDLDTGTWNMLAKILRLTSTSVRVSSKFGANSLGIDSTAAVITTFGEGIVAFNRHRDITVANLNTTNTTMAVRAEGTANDDITQNFSLIELNRVRTLKIT